MSGESGSIAALGSSIAWGSADYVAGIKARSLGAFRVVLYSQVLSCLCLLVLLGFFRPELELRPIAIGVIGGCAGGFGLMAFYRAMAIGAISVATPVSALGVCVPVAISAVGGELPTLIGQVGILLAIIGIVAVSIEKRDASVAQAAVTAAGTVRPRIREGVVEAVVAAFGFGIFMSSLNLAMDQEGASTLVVTTSARTGSAILLITIAILTSVQAGWPGRHTPAIFAVGMVDFVANSMLAWASTRGSFAVVAVLGSLYPLVPMILARVLLNERLAAVQRAGTISIVVGVALIAASGAS